MLERIDLLPGGCIASSSLGTTKLGSQEQRELQWRTIQVRAPDVCDTGQKASAAVLLQGGTNLQGAINLQVLQIKVTNFDF